MLDLPVDVVELMHYRLSSVPRALWTPGGFFAKINKATILHYLLQDKDENVSNPKDALFIQDGNALFHVMKNLPPTFGEKCLQVLDQMTAKQHFVFSTDSYNRDSIKAHERLRRGFTEKYINDGLNTRKPCDFKAFLANEENKATVIVVGKSYQLNSANGHVNIKGYHTLYC